MATTGEQVEGDYPDMLNSAFFAETYTALERHCTAFNSPVVLISGTYRADQLNLLQLLAITRGLTLCEVPAHVAHGALLQRSISVLQPDDSATKGADRLEALCAEPSGPHTALLIPWVDLLDQQSAEALDIVLRRGNVGVFMTSLGEVGLGFRFAWALEEERGFRAHLIPLTDTESHQLLSELLDEPPTAALSQYLSRCTGYGARALAATARHGLTEGWIQVVRHRSVMSHMPPWLDRQAARHYCLRIRDELGGPILALLQKIAKAGRAELREFTSDAEVSNALFTMVGAGLLSIDGMHVSIRRPSDQRDLLLGPQEDDDAAATSPYAVFSACAAGYSVGPHQAAQAAWVLLEDGLFAQARLLARSAGTGTEWAVVVEACADVGEGAPFRALNRLGHSSHRSDTQPLAEPQHTLGDVSHGLSAFISGVLLRLPPSDRVRDDRFGPLVETLDQLETVTDTDSLMRLKCQFPLPRDTALIEPALPAPSPSDSEPETLPVDVLVQVAETALECYLLAHQGAADETSAALRRFDELSLERLPLVGLNWALNLVIRARLLTDPGQGALAAGWFQDESPERAMTRLLVSDAFRFYQGLVWGEPEVSLRAQLEDLWSQYEVGLAPGSVRRQLLEAFDYCIEGDRSGDLFGPVGMTTKQMIGAIDDPWVNLSVAIGRLLHCPVVDIEKDLESELTGWLSLPAIRRLMLRTLILRRGADLSITGLTQVIELSEKANVEPPVLDYARALAQEDDLVIDAARKELRHQHPNYVPSQRTLAVDRQQAGPPLRADRLSLLSTREKEVSQRLIIGDTEAQAAQALGGISVRTVQTHVRNIYRKLEVTSRTELRAALLAKPVGQP